MQYSPKWPTAPSAHNNSAGGGGNPYSSPPRMYYDPHDQQQHYLAMLHYQQQQQQQHYVANVVPPLAHHSNVQDAFTDAEKFKTEMCRKFSQTGFCRYGDQCQFAHGAAELRVLPKHPLYKTSSCKSFEATGTCRYGIRCRFIHDEDVNQLAQVNRMAPPLPPPTTPLTAYHQHGPLLHPQPQPQSAAVKTTTAAAAAQPKPISPKNSPTSAAAAGFALGEPVPTPLRASRSLVALSSAPPKPHNNGTSSSSSSTTNLGASFQSNLQRMPIRSLSFGSHLTSLHHQDQDHYAAAAAAAPSTTTGWISSALTSPAVSPKRAAASAASHFPPKSASFASSIWALDRDSVGVVPSSSSVIGLQSTARQSSLVWGEHSPAAALPTAAAATPNVSLLPRAKSQESRLDRAYQQPGAVSTTSPARSSDLKPPSRLPASASAVALRGGGASFQVFDHQQQHQEQQQQQVGLDLDSDEEDGFF